MTIRSLIVMCAVAVCLMAPVAASAAPAWIPIVPCGGVTSSGSAQPPCTPCHLFQGFKNVIDLVLYGITGPIAAFMVVLAGGQMLLSRGNPAMFKRGRDLLTNTMIGVTIILLSWVGTNFLIKTIVTGSTTDSWYQFSCPAFLQQSPQQSLGQPTSSLGSATQPEGALLSAAADACKPANLAATYKSWTNPQAISMDIELITTNLKSDLVILALMDKNQMNTYEKASPLCNLTYGHPVCGGSCQHSVNSCHYGGTGLHYQETADSGSMAVDFNAARDPKTGAYVSVMYKKSDRSVLYDKKLPAGANPADYRTVTGEVGLFDEIYRVLTQKKVKYGRLAYEAQGGNAHTHISSSRCDTDLNEGVRGRVPPILP